MHTQISFAKMREKFNKKIEIIVEKLELIQQDEEDNYSDEDYDK